MLKAKVQIDGQFGRSLILVEDVIKGTVVLEEYPFTYGPKPSVRITCLGCYRILVTDQRCPNCSWPLCGECVDNQMHANNECKVFSRDKVYFNGVMNDNDICLQLDCITPLSTLSSVKAGDILVEETPFAIGPKCGGGVLCLECYRPLNGNSGLSQIHNCEDCSWPLCGDCIKNGLQYHKTKECRIFQESRQKFYFSALVEKYCPQLDCITPLRVLLAKEAQSARWNDEVINMEYHDAARRQMTEIWHADRVNIAEYLRGPCKLADRFDEDLIMRVIGILEVNAFEARTPEGNSFRCLFPSTAILAHNCVPNTIRSIYPSEGYKVRLRAMVDISSGQQLQHSYTYTLNGTSQRIQHILTGKFFTCDCRRCEDPTELNTNFSSFKCSNCDDGWIWSSNPLDISDTCVWQCSGCNFKTKHSSIEKAIAVMEAEVAEVQAIDNGEERLTKTESLMRKYRSVVHPLHFIQTGLRQNLIEMYGRVEGFEMMSLPDVLLERKIELCRQVLRVLDVFEPGLSRMRALMLYELHVPLMLLSQNAFVSKSITSAELKIRLDEVITLLRESIEVLQHEDHASQEGILGKVAQQALEELMATAEALNT